MGKIDNLLPLKIPGSGEKKEYTYGPYEQSLKETIRIDQPFAWDCRCGEALKISIHFQLKFVQVDHETNMIRHVIDWSFETVDQGYINRHDDFVKEDFKKLIKSRTTKWSE